MRTRLKQQRYEVPRPSAIKPRSSGLTQHGPTCTRISSSMGQTSPCPGAVWARDYTNTSDLFLGMRKQRRYEVPRPSAIFGNSLARAVWGVEGEEECACEDKQTYSRDALTGNSEWLNTPREIKVCIKVCNKMRS